MTTEQLLTVNQVAHLLQRHPDTVRKDLRARLLPGRHVGRCWRIPAGALEERLRTDTDAEEARRNDRNRVADARAWLKAEKTKRKGG